MHVCVVSTWKVLSCARVAQLVSSDLHLEHERSYHQTHFAVHSGHPNLTTVSSKTMGQGHNNRMMNCTTVDSPQLAYASLDATLKQHYSNLLARRQALNHTFWARLDQGMRSSPSPPLCGVHAWINCGSASQSSMLTVDTHQPSELTSNVI